MAKPKTSAEVNLLKLRNMALTLLAFIDGADAHSLTEEGDALLANAARLMDQVVGSGDIDIIGMVGACRRCCSPEHDEFYRGCPLRDVRTPL